MTSGTKVTFNISLFDGLVSLSQITLDPDGGFKHFPVIGGLVSAMTEDFENGMKEVEVLQKWSELIEAKSFFDLTKVEDIKNVVFICSYQNLSDSGVTTEPENVRYYDYLSDAYHSNFNYISIGNQNGSNIYIYNTIKIDR